MNYYAKYSVTYKRALAPLSGGFATMIAVIFFLVAGLTITVGLTSLGLLEVKAAREQLTGKKALLTGEAGLEDVLYREIQNMTHNGADADGRGEIIYLNGGDAKIFTKDLGGSIYSFIIEGGGISRIRSEEIKFKLEPTGQGAKFDYALQAGYLGVKMENTSKITGYGVHPELGNVYSNGPVVGENFNDQQITNDAIVAINIGKDDLNNAYHRKHDLGRVNGGTPPSILAIKDINDHKDGVQSFVAPVTAQIYKIELFAKKVGNPNNIQIKIIGNASTGEDKAASTGSTCDGKIDISNDVVDYEFRWVDAHINWNCPSGTGTYGNVTEGEKYWIVINGDGAIGSKYYLFGADDDNSYEDSMPYDKLPLNLRPGHPSFNYPERFYYTQDHSVGTPYTDPDPPTPRDLMFRIYFGTAGSQKIDNINYIGGDARAEVIRGTGSKGIDIIGQATAKYISGNWNPPQGGVLVGSLSERCGPFTDPPGPNTTCWPSGAEDDGGAADCYCPTGTTEGKQICQSGSNPDCSFGAGFVGDPVADLPIDYQYLLDVINKATTTPGTLKGYGKVDGYECNGDVTIDNTTAWCDTLNVDTYVGWTNNWHSLTPGKYTGKLTVDGSGTVVVICQTSDCSGETDPEANYMVYFTGRGNFNNGCRIMLPPDLPGVNGYMVFDDKIDIDNSCEFTGSTDPNHYSYWDAAWIESPPPPGYFEPPPGYTPYNPKDRCPDPSNYSDSDCKPFEGTLDLRTCVDNGLYSSGECDIHADYDPLMGGDPTKDPKRVSLMVLGTTVGNTGGSGGAINMSNSTSASVLAAPRGSVILRNLVQISVVSAARIVLRQQAEVAYRVGLVAPVSRGRKGAVPVFEKVREISDKPVIIIKYPEDPFATTAGNLTISGIATDNKPLGNLTYNLFDGTNPVDSGSIAIVNGKWAQVVNLAQADKSYTFLVTVTDSDGKQASDILTINTLP